MTRERQQRRRRERQRKRRDERQQPVPYEPVGKMPLPGIMGWFQSNTRIFYVGGIAVMVLSLGAIFFGAQGGIHSGQPLTADIVSTSTPSPDATAATATDGDEVDGDGHAHADAEAADDGHAHAADAADAADATVVDDPIQRVYAAPPPFEIDVTHSYEVVILTEKGEIRIELFPDEAPGYVNNFVFLARNRFYDGLIFHRVVAGFIAQAGDPTATGFSGSGYNLPEEKNSLQFDAGMLSMAKAGASVNGSQFFITLEPAPHLNGDFTVFGRVIEGLDVLRALTTREPGEGQPPGDRILSIEVIEEPAADSG